MGVRPVEVHNEAIVRHQHIGYGANKLVDPRQQDALRNSVEFGDPLAKCSIWLELSFRSTLHGKQVNHPLPATGIEDVLNGHILDAL